MVPPAPASEGSPGLEPLWTKLRGFAKRSNPGHPAVARYSCVFTATLTSGRDYNFDVLNPILVVQGNTQQMFGGETAVDFDVNE